MKERVQPTADQLQDAPTGTAAAVEQTTTKATADESGITNSEGNQIKPNEATKQPLNVADDDDGQQDKSKSEEAEPDGITTTTPAGATVSADDEQKATTTTKEAGNTPVANQGAQAEQQEPKAAEPVTEQKKDQTVPKSPHETKEATETKKEVPKEAADKEKLSPSTTKVCWLFYTLCTSVEFRRKTNSTLLCTSAADSY